MLLSDHWLSCHRRNHVVNNMGAYLLLKFNWQGSRDVSSQYHAWNGTTSHLREQQPLRFLLYCYNVTFLSARMSIKLGTLALLSWKSICRQISVKHIKLLSRYSLWIWISAHFISQGLHIPHENRWNCGFKLSPLPTSITAVLHFIKPFSHCSLLLSVHSFYVWQ